jgi:hypothetical protein
MIARAAERVHVLSIMIAGAAERVHVLSIVIAGAAERVSAGSHQYIGQCYARAGI